MKSLLKKVGNMFESEYTEYALMGVILIGFFGMAVELIVLLVIGAVWLAGLI